VIFYDQSIELVSVTHCLERFLTTNPRVPQEYQHCGFSYQGVVVEFRVVMLIGEALQNRNYGVAAVFVRHGLHGGFISPFSCQQYTSQRQFNPAWCDLFHSALNKHLVGHSPQFDDGNAGTIVNCKDHSLVLVIVTHRFERCFIKKSRVQQEHLLCRQGKGSSEATEHYDAHHTALGNAFLPGRLQDHFEQVHDRIILKLLTPLTRKQIETVEKTLRGKVKKQTFPPNLQIPHTARDSHFPTASTATNL